MTLVLVDAAIKVSLLAVAGLAAAALLRGQAAALRHRVVACSLVCMGAMPLLGAVVPAWRLPLPAALGASDPGPVDVMVRRGHATAGLPADRGAVPPPSASQGNGGHPPTPRGPARVSLAATLGTLVVPFWLTGTAAGFLILTIGLARLGWLAARSARLRSGPWAEIADDLSRRHELRRPVVLLRSPHPTLLVTWGHRRPKVMLPAAAESWQRDRIEVVLAHELCHVRRGDWTVQIAAHLVRSLYWFNPLVWIACRRLAREAEHACDDGVLNLGIEGRAYARHLLELARAFSGDRRVRWPAPAIVRPCSLERRVRAMLTPGINRRPVPRAMSMATMLGLACLALPLAGLQVFAQSFSTVSGVVLDPQSRPLSDVTLVLSNAENRSKYEVLSDDAGRFVFVGLPDGEYALAAERFGFEAFMKQVSVAGRDASLVVPLQLGTVQETIVVTDSSSVQKTEALAERTADLPDLPRMLDQCRASAPDGEGGGNLRPPRKLRHVPPQYPERLKNSGIGGLVNFETSIAPDGLVTDVQPVTPGADPELVAAAIDAVRQWQFEPTLLNCVPVEVSMNVAIEFRPSR